LFHTPKLDQTDDTLATPRRPTKKLMTLPAAVEANVALLSKLTIVDDEAEDKAAKVWNRTPFKMTFFGR
jgi:hypothetical protein